MFKGLILRQIQRALDRAPTGRGRNGFREQETPIRRQLTCPLQPEITVQALRRLRVVYPLCRGFDPNANPLGVDTLVTVHRALSYHASCD